MRFCGLISFTVVTLTLAGPAEAQRIDLRDTQHYGLAGINDPASRMYFKQVIPTMKKPQFELFADVLATCRLEPISLDRAHKNDCTDKAQRYALKYADDAEQKIIFSILAAHSQMDPEGSFRVDTEVARDALRRFIREIEPALKTRVKELE